MTKKCKAIYHPEKDHHINLIGILGVLAIICGIVAGIVCGVQKDEFSGSDFSLKIACAYWIGGIIIGAIMIALGKIINLLYAIAYKEYIVVEEESDNEDYKETLYL